MISKTKLTLQTGANIALTSFSLLMLPVTNVNVLSMVDDVTFSKKNRIIGFLVTKLSTFVVSVVVVYNL